MEAGDGERRVHGTSRDPRSDTRADAGSEPESMIRERKRIVLYYPRQTDERSGTSPGMDLLPVALLSIAAWPVRDGYEVVIVDGNLYSADEAHRRVVEACEGALLYGTSGILGHQVADGLHCTRRVKARHPDLPAVIGGWFASVMPELQLATGLYDAVCLGQGEITFRELVQAVDAGTPLDGVGGLALVRDGHLVRTPPRAVVGWGELLNCPWEILDIEPYRAVQLAGRPTGEVERMPAPPGFAERPFFGISYFSSFGCPEPCGFCCSPEVSNLRWKAMPADRMVDDLCELHARWGFDTVRFYDANWGVHEKRSREFSEGMIAQDAHFWWYMTMQSGSVVRYEEATIDAMREAGLYVTLLGAETGDDRMMAEIGKHTGATDNLEAAAAMDRRGVCTWMTYIIGFPGESEASMMATLDEARRIAARSPLARCNAWPFRPIPGTAMYAPAIRLGYEPPTSLEGWAADGIYHLREPWPGQIPRRVARRRKLYEHYSHLALGLARERVGVWERRARRRIACGDYRFGSVEAKAFDIYDRIGRRFSGTGARRDRRGYQTSVLSGRDSSPGAESR